MTDFPRGTLKALAWLGSCVGVASATITWLLFGDGLNETSRMIAVFVLSCDAVFVLSMAIMPLQRQLQQASFNESVEQIHHTVQRLKTGGHTHLSSTSTDGVIMRLVIGVRNNQTTVRRHLHCALTHPGRVYGFQQHCVNKHLHTPSSSYPNLSQEDLDWMRMRPTSVELKLLLRELQNCLLNTVAR